MKQIERTLLEEVQRRFPLEPRPYKTLGQQCGLKEEEVFFWLEHLKGQGILRQISAIFHPPAFGYRTTLVAAAIPTSRLSQAVEVINAYPGVSHNYLRDHTFNVWFTIACPPHENLEDRVALLMDQAQVHRYLLLPIKRVFRIALILELSENDAEMRAEPQETPSSQVHLDEKTIALVRATQEDLPRVSRPFEALGKELGLSEEEVLAWLKKGLDKGFIRRFAGLVRHTKAGFRGNIMVAWQVPSERVEEIGRLLAQEKKITHCYERKSYPEWPYNLYTMLHTKEVSEALRYVEKLAQRFNLSHYLPLTTLKEFKKIRLKLFWPD